MDKISVAFDFFTVVNLVKHRGKSDETPWENVKYNASDGANQCVQLFKTTCGDFGKSSAMLKKSEQCVICMPQRLDL